ncbi:MAG: AbrB/MazE/SpoVT family DNA-binding domain-containing protein [Armatimonadetes bacterium]|nr:AbrB/MazE/SpoVT family DNA-binding domain-containing protein [Armatimonadota bacterium]PIX45094.1 MAG: hypothetical protein COZ56_02700 [Armatimonadetes bacterium CG_4_8_14_3_um_filter_58_9]
MTTTLTMEPSGQITLPQEWRDIVNTDTFLADMDKDRIILRPLPATEMSERALLIANPSFDFLRDEPDLYD